MKKTLTTVLLTLALAASAPARNIDLSTVPDRDTVQLTIYNSEDLTLVRETRKVTFKRGVNPLQFSWANTLIDPSSVELRFLTNPDGLSVLDTTFPHDKPQMLYWNVQSDFDGEAVIEITYFTSGITWSADYVCIADPAEREMGFEGFVRVHNHSGEPYDDASIRLVVGTINLVEKIAQLAQIPIAEADRLSREGADDYRTLRNVAAKRAMGKTMPAAADAATPAPKEIIKEGLSEYFIYTIEGTESIPDGWSKRLRSFQGKTVPFRIQYRYRPAEYGDRLVRMYLLTNDEASKLGETPLPDGMMRVLRRNERGSLSFLAQHPIRYIPIGDRIELNLGDDPEVRFELIPARASRDNLWMQIAGGNVFRRVDDGAARIEINSRVVGWDDHTVYTQRIGNATGRDIEVEVRRAFGGHVIVRGQLPNARLYDFQTVEFTTAVPAGEKKDHPFEVITRQGRNAQQNNVTLEPVAVEL